MFCRKHHVGSRIEKCGVLAFLVAVKALETGVKLSSNVSRGVVARGPRRLGTERKEY
jgi:hypothetical protein